MCRYYCTYTRQCLTSLINLQQSIWEDNLLLHREDMAMSYVVVLELFYNYWEITIEQDSFRQARYDDMANLSWKTESAY